MPVARYFLFVGGFLIALLFAADSYLPKAEVVRSVEVDMTTPNVRIRSDKKWPERIVYDMSLLTIVPVQTAAIVPAPAPKVMASVPAEAAVPAQAAALNSFAQLSPSGVKKLEHPAPRKRKVAKRLPPPQQIAVAQQPRFGFFANNLW